jgi:uncharacterized protein (TIGR02145 family)
MFKKIVFLSWTALFAVFALNFTACGDDESFIAKPQDWEKSCSSHNGAGSSSSGARVTGCETCEYGKLKDDRDGQTYRTVKIGNQWWMAENLNYAYLQPTKTLDSSSFCYDNDPENCKQYGRLYLFSAAMDSAGLFSSDAEGCGNGAECPFDHIVPKIYKGYSDTASSLEPPIRGVCPEGWHVPTVDEFVILFESVGGQEEEYWENVDLRSTSGWREIPGEDTANVTDSFGFSAYPAGEWYQPSNLDYPIFSSLGIEAQFFTTSTRHLNVSGYGSVHIVEIKHSGNRAGFNFYWQNSAQSVRCLKD